jgi:hypothetical protein
MSSLATQHVWPALLVACCLLPCYALAQDEEPVGPPEPGVAEPGEPTRNEALETVQTPFTPLHPEATEISPATLPAPPDLPLPDPCDWSLEHPELQEDARDFVRGITCYSYRWFDGLFGDEIDYPEDQVNGLLTTGLSYEQYDGFDERLRLRVRAPLPNLDNRFDLILGRGDDTAIISDTEGNNETFYNPGLLNRGGEDSWLLGLGARGRGGRKGWDWSVGVRLRSPPEPYVKAQWFYYKQFSHAADLRFRQTFFWRSDDGFGATARGDYSMALGPQNVLRTETVLTHSEVTFGTQWFVGQTWYRLLGDRNAFSLLTFIDGETDAEVPIKEYGLRLVWRRSFTRDWMYLSIGPTATWPRFQLQEERELSLGFGAWLEMEFGNWVYR